VYCIKKCNITNQNKTIPFVLFKYAGCLPASVVQSEARKGFAFFVPFLIAVLVTIFINAEKEYTAA